MIDEKRSRQNQARSQAIIPESVERYVAALKNGEEFPPIVLYPSAGKGVIVDGNNREAAYRKAGREWIWAFIIDAETPSEIIQLMTIDANAHHGVTPDLGWRLVQAQYLVDIGFDADQAAKAAAVTKAQLLEYQRLLKVDQRAKALKISGFETLPKVTRLKLAVIPNEPVFIQAARTAIDTGMVVEDVTKMVREVKAQPDEMSQITKIAETANQRKLEEQQRKVAGRRKAIKSPKQGLITGLGKISHADPAAIARCVITDIERKEMLKRCYEASERLLEITTAIEASIVTENRDAS